MMTRFLTFFLLVIFCLPTFASAQAANVVAPQTKFFPLPPRTKTHKLVYPSVKPYPLTGKLHSAQSSKKSPLINETPQTTSKDKLLLYLYDEMH